MIVENLSSAWKSLGSNRLRTVLSMLGIIIGVASVVAITTIGRSATLGIQSSIAEAGLETITVIAGRDAGREVRRLFVDELADDLERIDGVATALPINQRSMTFRVDGEYAEESVIAVDPEFLEVFSLEIESGRFIGDGDTAARSQVVVLGNDLAESLFGADDPVDEYVRVLGDGSRQLRVIGVLSEKSDTFGLSFDTSAYIPRSTYLARLERTDYVDRYVLRADLDRDVLETSEAVDAYMQELTGEAEAVRVMSPSTIAEAFETVTSTLQAFLTGIAAISLIVGGIGIMNIMLVSVTERTREIGIRKALGATPRRIMGQFLTEAIVLTVIGGAIGIAFGSLVSYLATRVLDWEFAIAPGSWVAALLVSTAVGLFFGLYPAARASRLDPAVALSYE